MTIKSKIAAWLLNIPTVHSDELLDLARAVQKLNEALIEVATLQKANEELREELARDPREMARRRDAQSRSAALHNLNCGAPPLPHIAVLQATQYLVSEARPN